MWPLALDLTRDECRGILRRSGINKNPNLKFVCLQTKSYRVVTTKLKHRHVIYSYSKRIFF